MHRRQLLASLGTAGLLGVAGCNRLSSVLTASPPQRRVTLVEQDSVPDRYDLQLRVEMIETAVTESHTARLRLHRTNTGRQRGFKPYHPFSRFGHSNEPRALWLTEADGSVADYLEDGRWVREKHEDPWPLVYHSPKSLERGESEQWEFALLDDGPIEGYFEPGRYRWERTFTIWKSGDLGAEKLAEFPWGFSLHVADPE